MTEKAREGRRPTPAGREAQRPAGKVGEGAPAAIVAGLIERQRQYWLVNGRSAENCRTAGEPCNYTSAALIRGFLGPEIRGLRFFLRVAPCSLTSARLELLYVSLSQRRSARQVRLRQVRSSWTYRYRSAVCGNSIPLWVANRQSRYALSRALEASRRHPACRRTLSRPTLRYTRTPNGVPWVNVSRGTSGWPAGTRYLSRCRARSPARPGSDLTSSSRRPFRVGRQHFAPRQLYPRPRDNHLGTLSATARP